MKPIRLGIIGATGTVGRTTLQVLEEWDVPIAELRLYASGKSSGRHLSFRGKNLKLHELSRIPEGLDAVIVSLSSGLSRTWVPRLREAGIIVIDHSSAFRMHEDVPLVIPEINAGALQEHSGLVANPNCSASVMLLPLAALDRVAGLHTVIAGTYQSASGAGQAALDELEAQTADESLPPRAHPRPIAFNVIPQIGEFTEHGMSGEEEKIGDEIRKILDRPDLIVMSTTVRVPVRVGHGAALAVLLRKPVDLFELETAWASMPGLVYDPDGYQTPIEIAGRQEVFVSRLRQDPERPEWVQFWVVGDNLRKGAASNAVQILQELFS